VSVDESRRGRPGELLTLAVSAALLSALYFIAASLISVFMLHRFVAASRDLLWMSPLSYLGFFLVAWIPVAAIGLWLHRNRALQFATLVFVALGVFAVLLPITSVARYTSLILAVGIGTVVARLAGRFPDAWLAGARRIAFLLAGILAFAAIAFAGWRWVAERQKFAALPQAPAGAPNILLVILDTVRGDELGCYGYPTPTTPALDSFAARGTLFETAIATAPWSLPSHGSIFTGHYAGRLNAAEEIPLDGSEPTLAELLTRQGYATAGFVANLYYTSWDTGLGRGFIRYSDYERSAEQVLKSSYLGLALVVDDILRARDRWALRRALRHPRLYDHLWAGRAPKDASTITNQFLKWSAERDPRHPYFVFLNYFDAHDPYDPIPEFRKRFVKDSKNPDPRDLYDAELAYLDQDLGRLFRELERRGDLKNTIVIITSDHGEHFGERGLWSHGNSLYYALLHVPLIIRFDGQVPAGTRVTDVVSLRDIGATILDLAGLGSQVPFPGVSLKGLWQGEKVTTSAAIGEYLRHGVRDPTWPMQSRQLVSLVDGDWHLIREGRQLVEEMFRYREDPGERSSLVGSPEGMATLRRMRETITRSLVADAPDPGYAAEQARKRAAADSVR
jgi:arylsulfatase A-like enzyme